MGIQILKFVGVGGLATGVHGAIYSLFISFELSSPYVANTIAYLVAVFFSYFGQRYATFSETDVDSSLGIFLRFVSVSFVGYGLNSFWVFLNVDVLELSPWLSLIGIGGLTPVVTFMLLKLWVFHEGK